MIAGLIIAATIATDYNNCINPVHGFLWFSGLVAVAASALCVCFSMISGRFAQELLIIRGNQEDFNPHIISI